MEYTNSNNRKNALLELWQQRNKKSETGVIELAIVGPRGKEVIHIILTSSNANDTDN